MNLSFHEKMAYFEETGEHFISLLEREEPQRTQTARKIIRSNIMKVKHAPVAPEKGSVRIYTGMEIGKAIADYLPSNREVKSWSQTFINIVGASTSIALVVVCLALVMGG